MVNDYSRLFSENKSSICYVKFHADMDLTQLIYILLPCRSNSIAERW